MPRNGSGVYSLPAGYLATTGQTATAAQHNDPLEDLKNDMNTARPVVAGGTGGATAAAARTNLSAQEQGDILDDLNTLGAVGAAAKIIMSDGAGSFSYEDVVGTVSQSGGTPTGALMEQGSNANGQYLRLADGTQICLMEGVELTFNTNRVQFDGTFPAAFASTNWVASMNLRGPLDSTGLAIASDATPAQNEIGAGYVSNKTATTYSAYLHSVSGLTAFQSGDSMYADILAVGTWF